MTRARLRERASSRPRRPGGTAGLKIAFDEILLLLERVLPVALAIERGETLEDPQTLASSAGLPVSEPEPIVGSLADIEVTTDTFSGVMAGTDASEVPGENEASNMVETVIPVPQTAVHREEVAAALVSFHRDMMVPRVAPFILNPVAPHSDPAGEDEDATSRHKYDPSRRR